MVELVKITDEKTAYAWLETQDQQTQLWFAARCSLRVLPALGLWNEAVSSGAILEYLRAVAIACSASTCAISEIGGFREVARLASLSGDSSFFGRTNLPSTAQSAGRSADSAVRIARSDTFDDTRSAHARSAADSASRSFDSSGFSTLSTTHFGKSEAERLTFSNEPAALIALSASQTSASADTAVPLTWPILWQTGAQPRDLIDGWKLLKDQLAVDDAEWSFWIEWYEAILNGAPLPWELIQRIALEITDDEWNEGQAAVAQRIVEIRAVYEVQILAKEIAENAYLAQRGTPGLGHNQPPSILDDDLDEQPPETIIWVAAKELEEQARADRPEPSRIGRAVSLIAGTLKAAGLWVAGTIATGISVATVAVVKKGADAWAVQNQEKLVELIDSTVRWLSLMP